MEESKINNFLSFNEEYFNERDIPKIREHLSLSDEEKLETLSFIQFRDPRVFFAISLLGGSIGLDRFLIGDVGMGLLKLLPNILTLFIPYLIDLFIIQKRVRKKNFEKLMRYI